MSMSAIYNSDMLLNAARAVVEPSKVRDYLLSPSHPVGRFKSVVFFALGYSQSDWTKLRDDLLARASAGEALPGERNQYGQKYTVSGTLTGPNGRTGLFTTVWLLETEASAPRLLTAYPE
jgi:hypothetical protein